MKSAIRRSQRDHSLAIRLSVVNQVERGELTYKKARERYGIQGHSAVLSWLRRHGRQDWSTGALFPPMSTVPKVGVAKPLTPEQQIKVLQVQLRKAGEKAQLFETIVEVLKEDYGVRIVKSLPASPHARARQRRKRSKGLPLFRHQPAGVLSG
jgi:transposase